MDLEAYRISNNLSHEQLAQLIELSSASHARRIAIGQEWPRTELAERILQNCPGVCLFKMHKRRLEWLRAHPKQIKDVATSHGDGARQGVASA